MKAMRSCPVCQRTYPDDNQTNCQYDGAQLSAPYYPQPGQYQPQQYGPPPGMNQMPPPPGANPMPPGYPPQPNQWQGYPPPAYPIGASEYVPCPRCRRPGPKKVGFTWWGGVLGPRMLSHVKCEGCGLAYNGKSGQSNDAKIAIYMVVTFVISLGLFLLIFFGLRR
jgi:hypothetical protein